jgi:hypothetical protein
MRYQQLVPPDPCLEVVSTEEAARQCFVSNPQEFPYLRGLVKKAVEWIERTLSRQLLTATWCCYLDAFPNEIVLERCPVQTVTQIEYTDTEGNSQILPPDQYQFDVASQNWPARVQPAYGLIWPVTRGYSRTWPTIEANHLGELPEITGFYNAVQVTFTAGYGTPEEVPPGLRHAILLAAAGWYRDREPTTIGPGITVNPLPHSLEALLSLEDWGQYA